MKRIHARSSTCISIPLDSGDKKKGFFFSKNEEVVLLKMLPARYISNCNLGKIHIPDVPKMMARNYGC